MSPVHQSLVRPLQPQRPLQRKVSCIRRPDAAVILRPVAPVWTAANVAPKSGYDFLRSVDHYSMERLSGILIVGFKLLEAHLNITTAMPLHNTIKIKSHNSISIFTFSFKFAMESRGRSLLMRYAGRQVHENYNITDNLPSEFLSSRQIYPTVLVTCCTTSWSYLHQNHNNQCDIIKSWNDW